jgi:peroxiredoxin
MRITSLMSAACIASAAFLSASLTAAGPVAQDAGKSDSAHTDKPQKDDKVMKAEKAEIGHPAPAFSLKGVDGKTYSLADMKGKTVVIEWFSPYCPYSGQSSPDSYWSTGRAKKVIDGMKAADADAVYLCINSTHPGYNGKSESENGTDSAAICKETPMLMDADGAVGKAYGAKTTPHMFVIDGDGKLAYIGAPTCDDGKDLYVVNAVAAIKEGKEPSPSVTKNKGCSVKYAKK